MEYSVTDYFYELYDFFTGLLPSFRNFLVGSDSGSYKRFLFIAIPVLFAALEAIFDWIIPTFLDLQPLGLRRLVAPKLEAAKVPEIKLYKPVKSDIRFKPFRRLKNNVNFTAAELKHYQKIYQQRYNTTPHPYELTHFIIKEKKSFSHISRIGAFKQNAKAFASAVQDYVDRIKAAQKK